MARSWGCLFVATGASRRASEFATIKRPRSRASIAPESFNSRAIFTRGASPPVVQAGDSRVRLEAALSYFFFEVGLICRTDVGAA